MESSCLVALSALAASGALSGARGADMSFERALNADREPQNWLLHQQELSGPSVLALKEINTGRSAICGLPSRFGLGGLAVPAAATPKAILKRRPWSTTA